MDFSVLKGKTLTSIDGLKNGADAIEFTCSDGSEYWMGHVQDCCESVTISDLDGNPDDLIGEEILEAYSASDDSNDDDGMIKWTFYHLRTMHTSLTIRWFGENGESGYYSIDVDFNQTKKALPTTGNDGWISQ